MGVKQRRGASASDGGAKPADSRRARKDAEWRSVKRVAQLFVLMMIGLHRDGGHVRARARREWRSFARRSFASRRRRRARRRAVAPARVRTCRRAS